MKLKQMQLRTAKNTPSTSDTITMIAASIAAITFIIGVLISN